MSIQRRVALIGSGAGPWISTLGLREPVAKVTGMQPGGLIRVYCCHTPGGASEIRLIEGNGKYDLKEVAWMMVECQGGGRKVICDILSKKVA